MDKLVASPGESITVVGWIESNATRGRMIDDNGFGPGFMDVVVTDSAGGVVFDWAASRPRTHGPLLIVQLAPGAAVTQTVRFSLPVSGRYVVSVRAGFRAQRPDAKYGDLRAEAVTHHMASAPPITLTIR
jgi:hypothetical protein